LKLIEEVAGYKAKYLRPPFGAYNDQLINYAKENGMEVLNWTDGSLDWEGVVDGYKDPKLVVEQVMEQLHPGAVVLLHDTLKHTAEALPEIITKIKAEGYEFIVLN
ncbi:MAG TPA: polysaccharide deacetylase family protein, partial [Symbiobacteriaceae bacterium]|nr:polysaccharide deacetylase family protein [Symbiobacteriaceae bacterium]